MRPSVARKQYQARLPAYYPLTLVHLGAGNITTGRESQAASHAAADMAGRSPKSPANDSLLSLGTLAEGHDGGVLLHESASVAALLPPELAALTFYLQVKELLWLKSGTDTAWRCLEILLQDSRIRRSCTFCRLCYLPDLPFLYVGRGNDGSA